MDLTENEANVSCERTLLNFKKKLQALKIFKLVFSFLFYFHYAKYSLYQRIMDPTGLKCPRNSIFPK